MTATFNDDDEGVFELNETEAAEVEALSSSCAAKFERIKALIAEQRGARQTLSENADLMAAAKDAYARWELEAVLKGAPRKPITPLEKLLQEHWELEERILDIQDGALARYLLSEAQDEPTGCGPGLSAVHPVCLDRRPKPIPGEWYLGVSCALCDEMVLYAPDFPRGHGKLAFFDADDEVQDRCVRGHLTSFRLDEMRRFQWRPRCSS